MYGNQVTVREGIPMYLNSFNLWHVCETQTPNTSRIKYLSSFFVE